MRISATSLYGLKSLRCSSKSDLRRWEIASTKWLANTSLGDFFFQGEDGIRDYKVTGVQTCALPICGAVGAYLAGAVGVLLLGGREGATINYFLDISAALALIAAGLAPRLALTRLYPLASAEIGRASCRDRWRSAWSGAGRDEILPRW